MNDAGGQGTGAEAEMGSIVGFDMEDALVTLTELFEYRSFYYQTLHLSLFL